MRAFWTVAFAFGLLLMLTSQLPAQSGPQDYTDFASQVLLTVKALGGVSFMGKASLIITLLISSMKCSALNDLVWRRIGEAQVWVAPALGLAAGILGLGAAGAPVTAASVLAYVAAGGGAVFVHELLDSAKALPAVGPAYRAAIAFVESKLGGGPKDPPASGPSIASTLK